MSPFGQGRRATEAGGSTLEREVKIPARMATLSGTLTLPSHAPGLVLFAHGSGSSRHSPRNRTVARTLNEAGLATLLFDLLTREEEEEDQYTGHLRFNIGLLADRLGHATAWLREDPSLRELAVGYFGSSTGGGAALVAAAADPAGVRAVVSRGGRPDLAGSALEAVRAPTLLIVGGDDDVVIDLNRTAMEQMSCEVELEIIPGATHLFEERGALEKVAQLASDWFLQHFVVPGADSEGFVSAALRKLH
ncbi:MAG: alpha/beta hydrolase [Verrucomicrobiaceae bacterium]|nr:MAG: alpha/beta hydrolase [Verrucomicrobiaceae bacterium]